MARLSLFFFAGFMATPLFCGSIEGVVTNAVTGEPVSNAEVRFVDAHSHPYSTATDARGAYRLTGLEEGSYQGEFSKEGYSEAHWGSSVDSLLGGAGMAHVSGDTPARVDATLQPWGGLRGRVVDEDGKPAAGVTVNLSRSVDNTAVTNADGVFGFEEVEPGSYTVVAKPPAAPHMREGERVGSVPVYYPSALELGDAVPIRVNWGQDVAGIEIRLKSVPVRRVSGVVVDAAGKPVAHAAVRLLGRPGPRGYLRTMNAGPRNDPVMARPGTTTQQLRLMLVQMLGGAAGSTAAPGPEAEIAKMETGDDGVFAFEAVPPGDWRIAALTDEFGWKPLNGVVSATVGDKDVEDVRIRVSPPFLVDVTTDWGADGPDHPATSMAMLAPLEAQQGMFFDPSGPPPEVFPVLSGRYRVMGASIPTAGYYVSSITLAGAEVLGQVIDLEPGSGPLRIALRHDAGSAKGRVEKGEGSTVFLVSREAGELVHVRQTKCDPDGSFTFGGVPPGDYYAVAFDRVPSGRMGPALPVRDLPASIASQASSVRVESGAEASVELRVNTWRD